MPLTKSLREFVLEALDKGVRQVEPSAVQRKLHHGEKLVLLDVRESDEYQRGHLPGALLIPRGVLENQAPQLLRDTDVEIVVYCGSGRRSVLACDVLQMMGYSNVASMHGGFRAWGQFGGRVDHD